MSLVTTLNSSAGNLADNLNSAEQTRLRKGEIVLAGKDGNYAVCTIVKAPVKTVWQVLTAYEQFPDFLPSVVSSRVLERRGNCVLVERRDRRKVGWMPIRVTIVTENIEIPHERIDYRMVDGTLDSMGGSWKLSAIEIPGSQQATLLVQSIKAEAKLGPLQGYFYEVFETGLVETMTDLRSEMEI